MQHYKHIVMFNVFFNVFVLFQRFLHPCMAESTTSVTCVFKRFFNIFISSCLQYIYAYWKQWQLWCICGCVEIDYVWDFGVRRPQGFLLSLKQTCPDGCTGGKLTYVVCQLFDFEGKGVLKMQDWTMKVKSTIRHEECWWGAHLPYLGWADKPLKSVAWPDRRQTYG